MFFPESVQSVTPGDRVLEIGPGGTPHPRADVFLELRYDDAERFRRQRGGAPELVTDKQVVWYGGGTMPFGENEFDYVICSHVLEHVPDVEPFVSELSRVAKAGYLEFPTIYYDYVYNIPEHLNLLMYKDGIVHWMKKTDTPLNDFAEVHSLFFAMLENQRTAFVYENKRFFFQGFEWRDDVKFRRAHDLKTITFAKDEIHFPNATPKETILTLKDRAKIKARLLIDRL